jgi:hypothetical protein
MTGATCIGGSATATGAGGGGDEYSTSGTTEGGGEDAEEEVSTFMIFVTSSARRPSNVVCQALEYPIGKLVNLSLKGGDPALDAHESIVVRGIVPGASRVTTASGEDVSPSLCTCTDLAASGVPLSVSR